MNDSRFVVGKSDWKHTVAGIFRTKEEADACVHRFNTVYSTTMIMLHIRPKSPELDIKTIYDRLVKIWITIMKSRSESVDNSDEYIIFAYSNCGEFEEDIDEMKKPSPENPEKLGKIDSESLNNLWKEFSDLRIKYNKMRDSK